LLPKFNDKDKEPLYIGFFHTGAYQDAVSGYGGAKHCLIPSPKQIIIDKDKDGNLIDFVFSNEQKTSEVFKILGYPKTN
jgi:arginine decarboxylase